MTPALATIFLLAASIHSFDRTVRVPAGDGRSLRFALRNSPADLDLEFQVQPENPPVQISVRRQSEEIFATAPTRQGRLIVRLSRPGEYVLLVNNRAEPKREAYVRLRGRLVEIPQALEVRYASPQRRIAVVASTLGVFFTVAWFVGRRLWKATVGRRTRAPHLPSG